MIEKFEGVWYWTAERRSWNHEQIADAVKSEVRETNAIWQKVRLSMKGISTLDKLQVLEGYLRQNHEGKVDAEERERVLCRVDNYINALKRGGQLGVDGAIQR